MTTLQRSSVSFRRQGSSGRIWDDPIKTWDGKGSSTTSAATTVTVTRPPLDDDHPNGERPRPETTSTKRPKRCIK
ncbi:hypothetical protein QJS10_CPB22g01204 [Acorus calamus]|uniref:Uncharacterized protein n=1 Tax=Acorus calamus TaxID=4465 RepID=A0AAV9BYS7_ACOCL|nr:hypothetical protein QJS10_CPB22g01204 [Acorus calamus]